jgi:glutathione synthase/RimK-type ligase-like ATP-grasp enzyme
VIDVAVITCAGEDVDSDTPLLRDALRDAGVTADIVVWDDPSVNWSNYRLPIIRSTWDYAPRRDEFVAWAHSLSRLVNPASVIEWNTDKHYLGRLAAAGVPIIPTTFIDRGTSGLFPTGPFVVKPAVGAGSLGADRFLAAETNAARVHVAALHAQGRDAIVQPYIEDIDELGELALIFIEGQFVHAMNKGAMLNVHELDRTALYRREQMTRSEADPDALAVARAALRAANATDLLYARVDLVSHQGQWLLMELELTEPSLFLSYSPDCVETLVQAISRRLAR